MERYNINVQVKNIPALDPGFIPILKFNQAFLAGKRMTTGMMAKMEAAKRYCHSMML